MTSAADSASSKLESLDSATLLDLGGEDAVLADSDAIATSAALPLLVEAVEAGWNGLQHRDALVAVLRRGLRSPRGLVTFERIADAWLRAPKLLVATKKQLAGDFEAIAMSAVTPLVRVAALEKLLRLAEHDPTLKFPLIAAIMHFDRAAADDQSISRAIRLVGGAYDLFRDPQLVGVLGQFASEERAVEEVEFEAALIDIDFALDAVTADAALEGLTRGKERLDRTLEHDPDHVEAAIYRDVLDCVIKFGRGKPSSEIGPVVDRLRDQVTLRKLLQLGDRPRAWLGRRIDTQAQWLLVIDLLNRVGSNLERPTWLEATRVLDEVFTLYRGRVGEAERPGLAATVAPRIETSFIRRQQQLGLLDEYIATVHTSDWGETAVALRRRIGEVAGRAPPGKA